MALSMFIPSVSGMEAQSHAIGQVSTNLANMNTVGYKSNETMFYTLLGSQPVVKGNSSGLYSSRVDVDGVGYYDRTNVDQQGIIRPTGNNFDVAINGTGNAFFSVREGDRTYYTRAGNFLTRSESGVNYLVTQGGLKVQGFPATEGGFGSSPEDIIIDPQKKIPSTPTSKAEIIANVPATGVDTSSYSITVYGPNNNGRTMNMKFDKSPDAANTWNVSFTVDDGTVVTQPIEAVFDANGKLLTPQTIDVNVDWDGEGNGSNSITLDISKMTQFAGNNNLEHVSQDGTPGGDFIKSFINSDGVVQAQYSNNKTINIAKLAVVGFTSPNSLSPISNTVFEATADAGASYYLDDLGKYIAAGSVEQAAVNPEQEFSKLIVVQRAYTINANAFTTNNEMLQTVVNLKT